MTALREAALKAWNDERRNWMISGFGAGNRPSLVYRMVDAHEEDKPVFSGPDMDCHIFIDRHCMDAAIAAVFAALREPTEGMVRAGYEWAGPDADEMDRDDPVQIFRAMLAEAERAAADGKGE